MEGWTSLGQPGSEGAGPLRLVNMCVGANADTRLEVFAIDSNGLMHHIWEVAPDTWSEWAILDKAGGPGEKDLSSGSDPRVARQRDGRLQVFASAGSFMRTIYEKQVGTNWSGWGDIWDVQGLYGDHGNVNEQHPAVGSNEDGRLDIFTIVHDTSGFRVYHKWQTQPSGSWHEDINLLGNPPEADFEQLAVGSNADGRLEVFALGGGGVVWHVWQTTPGSSSWSPWVALPNDIGVTGPFRLGRNQDGRLELFAQGTDGAFWHIWQVAPNGGWSGWDSMGGRFFSHPIVSIDPQNRLQVFGVDTDRHTILVSGQTLPNGGWSGWSPIGTSEAIAALEPYPSLTAPVYRGRDDMFPRLRLFAIDAGVLWVRQVGAE